MATINNVSKSAPVWMQNVTAALLMAQSAKPVLIDSIPGISEAHATLAGQWFDWVANVVTFAFAVVTLFTKARSLNDKAQ